MNYNGGYAIVGVPNNNKEGSFGYEVGKTVREMLGIKSKFKRDSSQLLYNILSVPSGEFNLYFPKIFIMDDVNDDAIDMILEIGDSAKEVITREGLMEKISQSKYYKKHNFGPLQVYALDSRELKNAVNEIPLQYAMQMMQEHIKII